MLRENWTTFSITANKYFLPTQSNFIIRFKAISHFTSQNLEAIDQPVPEIKNDNDRHKVNVPIKGVLSLRSYEKWDSESISILPNGIKRRKKSTIRIIVRTLIWH